MTAALPRSTAVLGNPASNETGVVDDGTEGREVATASNEERVGITDVLGPGIISVLGVMVIVIDLVLEVSEVVRNDVVSVSSADPVARVLV